MTLTRTAAIGFGIVAFLSSTDDAYALVRRGAIRAGGIVLPANWPKESSIKPMLRGAPIVGGHYFWAPTWGNGSFSATYLFRGNEEQIQKMIDDLDRIKWPGTTVCVHDSEGFDDPSRAHGTKETICYDWRLRFSKSQIAFDGKMVNKERRPHMHLSIFLGTRLNRDKIRIPDWMRVELLKLDRETIIPYPANALHAIARAARDD